MSYNLSSIFKDSLQFDYDNSNLSKEVMQHQNMNKYQINQSMDITSNIKSSSEDTNLMQNILRCPICAFITSNRSKFTEHLINHYTSKCNNSNFKAVLAQLPVFKFLQDKTNCSFPTLEEYAHDTKEFEKFDKSKFFRMNLQNNIKQKNKGFREAKICKQCNFVANTKIEYWEHMRYHIKGFTCSECSFVTKYKHHMNHHWLSVHDGSKPFKCKKCSYTCVSKSMLTSHLKKHSNVYPYRCANCTYKTKFCNALKKHLRKKEHQPAMVLNADGSPNPLSIIDVYGTKRGPKQKPPAEKQELDQNTNQTMMINNNQLSSTPTSSILSLQSPVAHYLTVTTMNEINDTNWTIQNSMKQNQSVMTYSDLIAAFNLSNHLLLHEDTTFHENMQEINHAHADALMEYVKIMKMPEEYIQNLSLTCFDTNDINKFHISDNVKTASESSTFLTLKTQLKSQKDESTDAPLDLRITDVIGKNSLQFQLLTTNSSKIVGTNKRKGRAMKLERRVMEENMKSEQKEESLKSSTINEGFREKNQDIKDIKSKAFTDSINTEHICHYCEITFGNVVMYTMHMGCHGFDDPYTCNMCGHHCTDKFSFFLHIARSRHA